jgi:hypothetical protein
LKMRRKNDLLLFVSAVSGAVLPLTVAAALNDWNASGLWIAMHGGGKEFHPLYLRLLLCTVPAGTLLGIFWVALRSGGGKENIVSLLLIWLASSTVDFVFLFYLIDFLGFST